MVLVVHIYLYSFTFKS